MDTIKQAFYIILSLVATGWLAIKSYQQLQVLLKRRKGIVKFLFQDFKQKMWMTLGLGITFFGLYFLLVLLGSRWMDQQTSLQVFFLAYQNPINFIYLGLFIFVATSLLIYLVRTFIKYLFTTYSKK